MSIARIGGVEFFVQLAPLPKPFERLKVRQFATQAANFADRGPALPSRRAGKTYATTSRAASSSKCATITMMTAEYRHLGQSLSNCGAAGKMSKGNAI